VDSWLIGCLVMSKPSRVSACAIADAKKTGPARAPASSRRSAEAADGGDGGDGDSGHDFLLCGFLPLPRGRIAELDMVVM
jgi:hypothetical protein